MNEKIKQFAIECAGQKEWNFPKDPESYTFTPNEITRFANFIVNECLSKIENEAAQYAEPVWAVELVNDIKEHFGVE